MKRFTTLIALLIILAIFGSACAAQMPPEMASAPAAAPSPAPTQTAGLDPAPPVSGGAPASPAPNAVGEAAQPDESVVALPLLTASDSRGRRLIYTVDMDLQTTTFMQGRRTILNTAARLNGYVERANVQGRDIRSPWTERSAGFTLRIHSDNLAEFIVVMEDEFNLLFFNQESDDVTAEFEHTEATLDDLHEQEERLRDLLENTTMSDAERRNLNRQLSDLQANIRNRERQRNVLDDHFRYSTVNIRLFEVIFPEDAPEPEPEEPFGVRFSRAVGDMASGFIRGLQAIAIGIISILPALIILAVIAVVVIMILRKAKKANDTSEKSNSDNNHNDDNNHDNN